MILVPMDAPGATMADGPDEVHRASVAKLELKNERRIPAERAWDA